MWSHTLVVWVAGALVGGSGSTSRPATRPALPDGVDATVNGQAISRGDLEEFLRARFGPAAANELVVAYLVRQEMVRRNLKVTPKEVDDLLARRIAQSGGEEAFNALVQRTGATREYVVKYDLPREVMLRKLTASEVKVTDEEVQGAFVAAYGERRQIRLIMVRDIRVANDLQKQLEGGADFVDLARRFSEDPRGQQQGGLLPPFGKGALVPAERLIEEETFKLEVGKTSGLIMLQDRYYLLKLERIIPPDETVKFEAVKDRLREQMLDRRFQQASQRLVDELRNKAQVVVNAALRGG